MPVVVTIRSPLGGPSGQTKMKKKAKEDHLKQLAASIAGGKEATPGVLSNLEGIAKHTEQKSLKENAGNCAETLPLIHTSIACVKELPPVNQQKYEA
ncbi:hypothetical protein FRC04_006003 [Tulasnella sp. 424]|nr:hypothetical protein FRC04_006003 [Tulasnella sp. 424]KAG8975594.1 hypothetical protein FRC05_005387 [Tulasnella sp. 425]